MKSRLTLEDRVRLLGVPAQVERDKDRFPETYDLCVKAVGSEFTVRGFNHYDMAELWIDPHGDNSDNACDDSVWIEPEYLEVVSVSKSSD